MSKSSRINDRPFQEVKVSTKAVEGFFIGTKFSLVYGLLYAPFRSKEQAIANGTYRLLEFLRCWGRATFLGCLLTTSIWGTR